MSLVYRTIWRDQRTDVCGRALIDFTEWASTKSSMELKLGINETATAVVTRSGEEWLVSALIEHAVADPPEEAEILRAVLTETCESGVRWEVTLRAWRAGGESWIWVDLSVLGDIDIDSVAPAAPRLARSLLESSTGATVGTLPLRSEVVKFRGNSDGEKLAELVSDFDRSLPIVVFTEDVARFEVYTTGGYTFESLVEMTANYVAGIARVAIADREAATAMSLALGTNHGVWDGAFRVYLKEVDPASNDSWRHRYVTAQRFMGRKSTAARMVSRLLGPTSVVRRPPPSFDRAKAVLDHERSGRRDLETLYNDASKEIAARDSEIISFRSKVQDLEDELYLSGLNLEEEIGKHEATLQIAANLEEKLKTAVVMLSGVDGTDELVAALSPQIVYPDPVSTALDAVRQANSLLYERVVIHPEALQGEDVMDRQRSGPAWARLAWRAFRSLNAYAIHLSEGNDVSFAQWCQHSSDPLVLEPGKYAARETAQLMNNAEFRRMRVLPVAREFDSSESCEMEQHIKVQAKGGGSIPRIYFVVDKTACKVHVGFYGPHNLMRNFRS